MTYVPVHHTAGRTSAAAASEAAADYSAALPKDSQDASVMTGGHGVARVAIDRPGLWNVRTLHAAPAGGSASGRPAGEREVAFATIGAALSRI